MEFLDNFRSNLNSNPSYYTTLGGVAGGGGALVAGGMLIASAPISLPLGIALTLATAVGSGLYYLGSLKGGKFDLDELKVSATPAPNGTTKIAAAETTLAPAIEQPTRTAALTVESPSATLPRNAADTAVQAGRG